MTPSEVAILTAWKQAGGKFKAAAEEVEKEIKMEERELGQ